MDIPLVGGNFTWSNSLDHPPWSRIDMFLLSPNWEPISQCFSEELPRLLSDHFPLLLE
jgi:hypothetical protein